MSALEHGASKYAHDRCRCEECRRGHRELQARENADRAARLAADPSLAPHGRRSTYSNWGCRCRPCTDAQSVTNALHYQQRKQRAEGVR